MKQSKLSQQQRAILTCTLAHVQERYPNPGIVNKCNLPGEQIQGIEKFLSILDIRLDKVKKSYHPSGNLNKSSQSASFSRSIRRLEERGLLICWLRSKGRPKGRKTGSISLTQEGYKIANILISGGDLKYEKPESLEQELRKFLRERKKRLRQKKKLTVTREKGVEFLPKNLMEAKNAS